jgi:flagellar hook protein FlgE
MFTSFSTALSALNAFSTAVDVVGNNLANLNTTGYKASTATFHDLVAQSMNSGEAEVGMGVNKVTTERQFTQGAIQASSGPLDVAIHGDGFLIVKNESGTMYTRAGNLRIDSNGGLTTSTGERVQGWTAAKGVVDAAGAPGDISLTSETRVPKPTRSFSIDMNLNAAAKEDESVSSEIRIFDSLGASHLARVTLTKSATVGEWDYSLSIPDDDVETAIPPVTGTLTFDNTGKLTSPALADDAPVLEISGFSNGAADLELSWNLFNGLSPRVTQFTQPSSVSGNAQDGGPAAEMTGFALADGGLILAKYSDGNQSVLGQLAMASIRNPESLIAVGDNNYQLSARSALPAVGLPGTGGRGKILGSATEGSTVDMAREFTNLIVLQRGYQANSKVVTTVDEMSQETLSLKR